jgi:hypothetical protein
MQTNRLPARAKTIAALTLEERANLTRYKWTYEAATIVGAQDHDYRARYLVFLRYLRVRGKLDR